MGIIDYGGQASIYGADLRAVQISSVRAGRSKCFCAICKRELPNGSIVVGKDKFNRVCIDCCPILFARIKKALKIFTNLIEETEKDLKLNAEKYRTQNISSWI